MSSGAAWPDSYLVSSTQESIYSLIEPGDAPNSWWMIKMEGTQGSGNGVQMPQGSSALSSTNLAVIEDWINDGAWQ